LPALGITARIENVPGVKAVHDHLRLAFAGPVGVFLAPDDVDNAVKGPDAYLY
jgi:hypothetical protein